MAGGSVTDGLHHPADSVVHRLPPEVRILATLVFVVAVVATPREAVWAFALDGVIVGAVAALAHLPRRLVLRRLRIELPFVAGALLLPFVGAPPDVHVLGVALSEPGLWGAWAIVVKGFLGVLAAIVLAGTTPVPELLVGLERLHAPRVLTAIAGFMVRYLDVVAGEAGRMRVARLSRGDDPRWLWQARATAAGAGTLFVRSYERGERVHLAMCARGYTGAMPTLHDRPRRRRSWALGALPPAGAVLAAAVARFAG